MDYWKLNSITVRDAFPLPTIDEALQAVHSSNWFSSFDLAQGYLQLAMEESDIKKTAFRASSVGLYEFTHMPFGLANAGSSPEKVEKVKTWPVPKNIKEVQSFLGLASYYRQFINKFAEKAQCLHELVGPTSNKYKTARAKKDSTTVKQNEQRISEWMMKHQEVFDALKEALSTAPILGYFDFSREFILETDASLKGLGAILSQQGKDGQIHVIAYPSHSLHPSERSMCNYSSAKLRLLALKWAVTEKFRDYLLGS